MSTVIKHLQKRRLIDSIMETMRDLERNNAPEHMLMQLKKVYMLLTHQYFDAKAFQDVLTSNIDEVESALQAAWDATYAHAKNRKVQDTLDMARYVA